MAPNLLNLYIAAWQEYQDNLAKLALADEPWRQDICEAKATRAALFKLGGIEAMCLESGMTAFDLNSAVVAHMTKKTQKGLTP